MSTSNEKQARQLTSVDDLMEIAQTDPDALSSSIDQVYHNRYLNVNDKGEKIVLVGSPLRTADDTARMVGRHAGSELDEVHRLKLVILLLESRLTDRIREDIKRQLRQSGTILHVDSWSDE
jgi:hypothetical protein